jgi:hypothetical protein
MRSDSQSPERYEKVACIGGFSTGIAGGAGENGHAAEGEWRLSKRGSPSRSSNSEFKRRRNQEMVFCIAVRLSRRTKNAIGAGGGPDMFWIEPRNPVLPEEAGNSPQQVQASQGEQNNIGGVRWYRLPGMAYIAE